MELFGILGQRIDKFLSFNSLFPNTPSTWFSSQLGTTAPIWIDCTWGKLWDVYAGIPHLNIVINKRAELLAQGRIFMEDINTGEKIKDHPALTLLKKPNPLQSTAEFLTQYSVFRGVYGNVPMLKNAGITKTVPDHLWNLPPGNVKVIPTGKIFKQTKLSEIIKEYELYYAGYVQKFSVDEIIFKNENLAKDYLKGVSKIMALAKSLSNIEGSLQTQNVLIQEHGAYGILSNQAKEDGGAIPLGKDERKRIEGQMNDSYGNKAHQRRVIITNSSLTYAPMSFAVKDMLLSETNEEHFGVILGAYGVDRDIFPSTKGATNENKETGLRSTIENAVQNEGDDLMQTLTEGFRLEESNKRLRIAYDHLPVMQAYKRTIRKTDEILSTNKSVSSGEIDRETAVNIIINQYGFEKQVAESMVTSTIATGNSTDSLGKIPLALQQLALARERANTANDAALSAALATAMDKLTAQLVQTVLAS